MIVLLISFKSIGIKKVTIFGSSPKNHNFLIKNHLLRIINLRLSIFVIQIYMPIIIAQLIKYK